jgi:uncharacterized protein (DUF1501 family)
MEKVSRRSVLRTGLLGTCGSVVHRIIAPSAGLMAWGSPQRAAALGSSPVMIVVNFSGGASYNVAPIYHGAYRDLNKTISYGPENSIALTAEQGLHPSLTAFKTVWDAGNLAVLNMVGYPNPNRSHADSTDIWFRGVRMGAAGVSEGWASRMTCQLGGIFAGVSLAGSNSLTQGECNPPRNVTNLASLGEDPFLGEENGQWLQMTRSNLLGSASAPPNGNYGFVRDEMNQAEAAFATLRTQTNVTLPTIANPFPNDPPTGFQRSCRDAARLLAARPLNVKFMYLERGGFDTHSGERNALTGNLNDVNAGLRSLVQTAQALGRWNDVIIVTMSEFCRTFENGSQGTDHGHAAPMFVMGGAINGRQVNAVPSPQETNSSGYYHNYQIDFRQVFREIVYVMGLDVNKIFPEAVSSSGLSLFR